jgi:hypothetical protein
MFKMKRRRQHLDPIQVSAKILYAEQGPNSASSRTSNGRTDEEQPSSQHVFARGIVAADAGQLRCSSRPGNDPA